MRVLIDTYDTAFQNTGGGVHTRIDKTVLALRATGIDVSLFDKFTTNIEEYDVFHFFKLDPSSHSLIKLAKTKGLKVVVSTVVNTTKKFQLTIYRLIKKLPISTTYKLLFDICDMADVLIVETKAERDFLTKFFSAKREKIAVIPNGAEPLDNYDDSIYDIIPRKRKYILQVGRFDKNKNQLNVIKALKESGIDLVLIGGPDPSSINYYRQCERAASGKRNIHFLGWLPIDSNLLKSAYAHSDIVVLPSFNETFGMVLLEGGAAGAKLAFSDTLPIKDYPCFRSCPTFNPKKPAQIYKVLSRLLNEKTDPSLKAKIMECFSWKKIGEEHKKVYLKCRTNEKNS